MERQQICNLVGGKLMQIPVLFPQEELTVLQPTANSISFGPELVVNPHCHAPDIAAPTPTPRAVN